MYDDKKRELTDLGYVEEGQKADIELKLAEKYAKTDAEVSTQICMVMKYLCKTWCSHHLSPCNLNRMQPAKYVLHRRIEDIVTNLTHLMKEKFTVEKPRESFSPETFEKGNLSVIII